MFITKLQLGDWVNVSGRLAVVCWIYEDIPVPTIEIVYLDDRNRAINENAHFINGEWVFVYSGPCGGYADKYPRLKEYVAKLRR